MLSLCWIISLACQAQAAGRFEGPYHVEAAPARRVRATISESFRFPGLTAAGWGVVAGMPPAYGGQREGSAWLRVPGHPEAAVGPAEEAGPRRQAVLAARWAPADPVEAQAVAVEVVYELTLLRRRLVAGAPDRPVPPLGDGERAASLHSGGLIVHEDPGFHRWLLAHQLRRGQGERDLDFAWRVLRAMGTSLSYRWQPGADPRPPVVCARGWGECGALSFVFVAALRANGIPARALPGRIARSSAAGKDFDSRTFHVRAEFHADGVGWVPVEPAGALAARGRDVSAWFGRDRGDLIALHFDDVIVNGVPQVLQLAVPTTTAAEGTGAGLRVTDAIRIEELTPTPDRPSHGRKPAARPGRGRGGSRPGSTHSARALAEPEPGAVPGRRP